MDSVLCMYSRRMRRELNLTIAQGPPLQGFSFCEDEMGNPSLQTILVQDLVFKMLLQSFQRRHPFFIPQVCLIRKNMNARNASLSEELLWVNKSSSQPAAPAVSIAVIRLP